MDTELERPLVIRTQAAERLRETQLLKKKNQELTNMTRKLEEKVKTLEKKSKEVTQQHQERSRARIVRQLPQTRAVPLESEARVGPQQKIVSSPQKTVSGQQKIVSAQKKTVSWQLRTVGADERTVNAPQRAVSASQRTVSASQRTVSAPQRAVSASERAVSAGERSSERSAVRERAGLQQRTTLTAKQRERESEYQRQIKERDGEIKRLKERMKVISDKLSKKNEIQILKEKGKKELVSIIHQLQKEKAKLELQMNTLSEEQRSQRESDVERFQSLEEENGTLLSQLNELNKLVQDHKEIQEQFEEKIEECEQLAESLHIKNELCDDLEKQLTRVIEKNTELTIQNSDLQRQIHELDSISSQCASLKESLDNVGTEYESAKFEVESLREKVSTLESVLKQMRDAAERKKELEKQHQEAQQQLRQKQEEIQKLTKVSESEKQASMDTIQTLESKIRELEKKAEVQSLRHEELMLEMSSLKKQSKYKLSQNGSPEGTITPDSMLLSTESTARSTPIGTAVTPASLEALPEGDETTFWSQRSTDIQLPVRAYVGQTAASLEMEKVRAQIESGTKFLAELDSRYALGLANSQAGKGPPPPQPVYVNSGLAPIPAGYAPLAADPRLVAAVPAGLYHDDKAGLMNGTVPGLLPANLAQQLSGGQQPGVVDVLDIPGKGKCQVFIARYSYDPFQHSPNEAPESELRLNAGDYVLVWGDMDEDGFLDGETLDGRRGLVPSNFVQKLVGDDLLEFHRQVVAGLLDCDQTSISTSVPHDLDFNSADEAFLNSLAHLRYNEHGARIRRKMPELQRVQSCRPHEYGGRRGPDEYPPPPQYGGYRYEGSVFSDDDEEEHPAGTGQSTELFFSVLVPPPRQLTLERQLNKSIVIGWTAPEGPPGAVDCYHVYVDGLLRTTVRATERTCALVEGVDSTRPHRISVRSVTPNRRTSRDAACTMLIGKDVPLAPTTVRATHVTSTSAVISWMPSNSNHQHTVCVNSVEVRTVKPGVYRHTITGISPNTTYRASVKVKNITAPQFSGRNSKHQERLATHIEFRTLPKGVPDPPVDVQCELGPQEGSLLVTWLPVTINSTSGTSNGAPVTGYAVYADGKKVTELGSPTGDHALIELNNIYGFHPRQVTVRTKSRDLVSADSVPCPIPQRSQRKLLSRVKMAKSTVSYVLSLIPLRAFSTFFRFFGVWLLSAPGTLNSTLGTRGGEGRAAAPPTKLHPCYCFMHFLFVFLFFWRVYLGVVSLDFIVVAKRSLHPTSNQIPVLFKFTSSFALIGFLHWDQFVVVHLFYAVLFAFNLTDSHSAPQYTDYETDELSDIPEEAENDLSDAEAPMEQPRSKAQHEAQHETPGSAHSSPLAGRRRMPPTVAPPRGAQYNQQVLETEDNLSDKEVYPSGYMSIPQIEITKDSASEGRCSVEFSEEDSDQRGLRGRRRPPAERARQPPPEPGREPRPSPRHRPDNYRNQANYAAGYRTEPGQGSSSAAGPPPPRRAAAAGGGREERMRIFVALFDYDPPTMSPNPDACDEELPFREGQLIKIYGDKDGDGFYWGEASGRAGYVPCNMVSEVQVDDERLAQELLKEEDRPPARSRAGGGQGGGGGGGGGARSRGQEDRWGDIYSSTPVRRMVALYDYDPQELSPNVDAEVELSFRTGDIIHIYGDMDDDGFYIGEVNGVRGLVPSNFLTETPQNYERRRGPEPAGPPLPPRDKGDSRDRRKGLGGLLGFMTAGPRSESEPTSATTPSDAASAGRRLLNGAPPPLAAADAKPSLLGGLSSPGGFIKGLGGGLTAAKAPSFVIPSGAAAGRPHLPCPRPTRTAHPGHARYQLLVQTAYFTRVSLLCLEPTVPTLVFV
ncbi:peripheral-type benzodiazepine receptor-associated protein 1-like [Pollicipes pollicipes]|uniref:peripheral-type benzodiazepine receptor-associated protein 1-like n=1 Tax=Pollicipes pollicipes TaxID=41117 RepID=UPI001885132D|nr:peripheral-type benzodiazepine receptor-associated protein 1-like [Pollicipes pollicipes]